MVFISSFESDCFDQNPSVNDTIVYLQRYGYLSDDVSIDNITSDEFSEALTHFQDFSGIEKMGQLDRNVIKVMSMDRCTQPDLTPTERKRRRKRSALSFNKWSPHEIDKPLKLNWLVEGEMALWSVIEAGSKFWTDATNIQLRRLTDPEESFYHNIIFNVTTVNDTYVEESKTEIKRKDLRPNFKYATRDSYPSFYVNLVLPNSADVMVGRQISSFMIHIWGHLLGLGHSQNLSSAMYPFNNRSRQYLNPQDLIDIQTLYGPPLLDESGNKTMVGKNPKIADWYQFICRSKRLLIYLFLGIKMLRICV